MAVVRRLTVAGLVNFMLVHRLSVERYLSSEAAE